MTLVEVRQIVEAWRIDVELAAEIRRLVDQRPTYGYRRTCLLRRIPVTSGPSRSTRHVSQPRSRVLDRVEQADRPIFAAEEFHVSAQCQHRFEISCDRRYRAPRIELCVGAHPSRHDHEVVVIELRDHLPSVEQLLIRHASWIVTASK